MKIDLSKAVKSYPSKPKEIHRDVFCFNPEDNGDRLFLTTKYHLVDKDLVVTQELALRPYGNSSTLILNNLLTDTVIITIPNLLNRETLERLLTSLTEAEEQAEEKRKEALKIEEEFPLRGIPLGV